MNDDKDATDVNATDEDATDEDARDEDATDEDETDEDATDEDATDEDATDEEATEEDATDEYATDEVHQPPVYHPRIFVQNSQRLKLCMRQPGRTQRHWLAGRLADTRRQPQRNCQLRLVGLRIGRLRTGRDQGIFEFPTELICVF